jgi:hypothetical protein
MVRREKYGLRDFEVSAFEIGRVIEAVGSSGAFPKIADCSTYVQRRGVFEKNNFTLTSFARGRP